MNQVYDIQGKPGSSYYLTSKPSLEGSYYLTSKNSLEYLFEACKVWVHGYRSFAVCSLNCVRDANVCFTGTC